MLDIKKITLIGITLAALSWSQLAISQENVTKKDVPKSGTLVIPSSNLKQVPKEEKKCMTVCGRWGQDCIIDPIRGRKCRRTCKEFEEQCF